MDWKKMPWMKRRWMKMRWTNTGRTDRDIKDRRLNVSYFVSTAFGLRFEAEFDPCAL